MFVRRLYDNGAKVYLTGSNASMLSSDMGTRLTGRYMIIENLPFSCREFMRLNGHGEVASPNSLSSKEQAVIKSIFQRFIIEGGFPLVQSEPRKIYLQSLYQGILYRDLVDRHRILQTHSLRILGLYLARNIGKELTYNSLKSLTGLSSAHTIAQYCEYFEESYVFFLLRRFDYSLKKQMASPKKIYCIDQGLAQAVGSRLSDDRGRFLENIVFLELRRRGFTIYYHKQAKECDFVIERQGQIVAAIQVCLEMEESSTRRREFDGLNEAMLAYELSEGWIFTLDTEETDGAITVIPIWKWLLSEDWLPEPPDLQFFP